MTGSAPERAALRAFGLLVRLLPVELRRARGPEMREAFGDECRERFATAGSRGLLLCAARGSGDLLRVAAEERWDALRDEGRRLRQAGGGGPMHDWLRDIRWAVRLLARSPGFTATAVVTLALGIGLNTGLFSITWSVLLKPLPFDESERTVKLFAVSPEGQLGSFSYPDVRDLRAGTDLFSELATSEIFGVALSREQETRHAGFAAPHRSTQRRA